MTPNIRRLIHSDAFCALRLPLDRLRLMQFWYLASI
jgi:hypothetical protein